MKRSIKNMLHPLRGGGEVWHLQPKPIRLTPLALALEVPWERM